MKRSSVGLRCRTVGFLWLRRRSSATHPEPTHPFPSQEGICVSGVGGKFPLPGGEGVSF